MEKLRTTIYLDKRVKRLAEDESLNLSKWVNDNLLIALCSENEGQLEEEILSLDTKSNVVKKRLEDLRQRKQDISEEEATKSKAKAELWKAYSLRSSKGITHDQNLSWIHSPGNLLRCKMLGKSPEEVLVVLEEWDQDEETS